MVNNLQQPWPTVRLANIYVYQSVIQTFTEALDSSGEPPFRLRQNLLVCWDLANFGTGWIPDPSLDAMYYYFFARCQNLQRIGSCI